MDTRPEEQHRVFISHDQPAILITGGAAEFVRAVRTDGVPNVSVEVRIVDPAAAQRLIEAFDAGLLQLNARRLLATRRFLSRETRRLRYGETGSVVNASPR